VTASVLYAWEFGANLGHVGTFLPIARQLRERGISVHWAVAQPQLAARLLAPAGFGWLQAPVASERRRERPPLNYGDILLSFGYDDEHRVHGSVVAWRELLQLSGARVLLADHAPTAILAALSLELPVMLFGNGFLVPPARDPTPNMRPWLTVASEELRAIDDRVLASINGVLDRFGKPRLVGLSDLFRVAEDALVCFPELDHYPDRGPARYWGMLPAATDGECAWPTSRGPRVFAYLRPETPNLDLALASLGALEASVLIYAPGLTDATMSRYRTARLAFSSHPVDLAQAASEADAAVTYASTAATSAFLLAGKPVLLLPGHLEQFLLALRVAELGAGLLQNPEEAPNGLPDMLHRVLTDPRLRANAEAFARKYAGFEQSIVARNIVARVLELAGTQTHRQYGVPA